MAQELKFALRKPTQNAAWLRIVFESLPLRRTYTHKSCTDTADSSILEAGANLSSTWLPGSWWYACLPDALGTR